MEIDNKKIEYPLRYLPTIPTIAQRQAIYSDHHIRCFCVSCAPVSLAILYLRLFSLILLSSGA